MFSFKKSHFNNRKAKPDVILKEEEPKNNIVDNSQKSSKQNKLDTLRKEARLNKDLNEIIQEENEQNLDDSKDNISGTFDEDCSMLKSKFYDKNDPEILLIENLMNGKSSNDILHTNGHFFTGLKNNCINIEKAINSIYKHKGNRNENPFVSLNIVESKSNQSSEVNPLKNTYLMNKDLIDCINKNGINLNRLKDNNQIQNSNHFQNKFAKIASDNYLANKQYSENQNQIKNEIKNLDPGPFKVEYRQSKDNQINEKKRNRNEVLLNVNQEEKKYILPFKSQILHPIEENIYLNKSNSPEDDNRYDEMHESTDIIFRSKSSMRNEYIEKSSGENDFPRFKEIFRPKENVISLENMNMNNLNSGLNKEKNFNLLIRKWSENQNRGKLIKNSFPITKIRAITSKSRFNKSNNDLGLNCIYPEENKLRYTKYLKILGGKETKQEAKT